MTDRHFVAGIFISTVESPISATKRLICNDPMDSSRRTASSSSLIAPTLPSDPKLHWFPAHDDDMASMMAIITVPVLIIRPLKLN
jgi:hypothetical protein